MDSDTLTGRGRMQENTEYDRSRHEKMRLKPLLHGYFTAPRQRSIPYCGGCGNAVENPTRFHNNIPYHVECYSHL